ncbi:portal_PBSX, phage portal protein, PBSX family [uncultured Caudovirales phage]|uniref:Portal_PBSX, phage portal protein, PBSX family n=1 Tax=uncultured Caudovirales phage TaxID=2100421 RepID=A0A6J7WEF0_9CAUD|nr:portal_PBSX, phage portal protein, PBSX family [uncultured Caudovirales phage]
MSELKKFQLSKIDFRMASFPIFSENLTRSPWVFYGENNLLPQYFVTLYDNCAIHKAIIKSKVNQILGDEIFSKDNPDAVWSLINEDENITDIMRKCALDFMLFGGFALNVIWSKDRKKIAEIYHLDFSRVRSGKVNGDTDKVDNYYYSPEWSDTRKYPPQEFPAFSKNEKDPVQIFYFKIYQPGLTYYPVPDWSAGQRSIEIDIEIKNFHMNNLRQGMVPSLWINYNNGIPGEEEQRILVRALESQYGGTDNAGQAIVSFNESKEQSPDIVQIPRNDHDSYYQSLYEDISRSILSSHRVSSAELFGISTPGKLGSRNEIIDHSEYFRKMVIMPYQEEILPVFNKLLSLFFQKKTTIEIAPLSIYEVGNLVQNPSEQGTIPGVSQTTPDTTDAKPEPPIKNGHNEVNRPQPNYPNLNN